MVHQLKDKVALVTGATRGIGLAIAVRFARSGARVIVTGTSPTATAPKGCEYRSVDFSALSSTEAFAEEVKRIEPDVLINNAGVNKIGPFGDIGFADFRRIQQVNLEAPFILCQAAIPSMRRKKWGRIVNICSIWGKIGKELRASYSASKFGLAGMTAALAAEVARDGIVVNCVSPGPIETEMTRTMLTDEMLQQLLSTVPAGRLGTPQEVAETVAWLASPENTFVIGQNVAVDGGMLRM